MSEVVDFFGGAFFPRGVSYATPKETSYALSFGSINDLLFSPCKRPRFSAFSTSNRHHGKQTHIQDLPDECLFEILRRVSGGQERSACACVSKRWLMILSTIPRSEFHHSVYKSNAESEKRIESEEDGFLSRCLEGKKATDLRLAAIAVGASSHGGLGKLSIRGNGVSNTGLTAIARSCPGLKSLSLWAVSSITDAGLVEIAKECHYLEKLDLYQSCVTDKALVEISKKCLNLKHLTLEDCPNIGNQGLLSVGQNCSNLVDVCVKNCPLIGDQGIASLVMATSYTLKKLVLHKLTITDVSLAVIGHYGKAVTELSFIELGCITERGFWVMGNCHGLQKLRSLEIGYCTGVTDLGVDAVSHGCSNLQHLHLDFCNQVTMFGIFNVLKTTKLKSLSLDKCIAVRDQCVGVIEDFHCSSIIALSIVNCPGVGDFSLIQMIEACPNLQVLRLNALHGITDSGFVRLINSVKGSLRKVSFRNCVNVSDRVVQGVAEIHGGTLEQLDLSGCWRVSDYSLTDVARHCSVLSDLDVSRCRVTDSGMEVLASAEGLGLQILSVSGCGLITDKSLVMFRAMGEFLLGLNLQSCSGISRKEIGVLAEQLCRCDVLPKVCQ